MATVLVVVRPFDAFKLGDLIIGAEQVRRITEGANARDVVRVKAQLTTTSKRGES